MIDRCINRMAPPDVYFQAVTIYITYKKLLDYMYDDETTLH